MEESKRDELLKRATALAGEEVAKRLMDDSDLLVGEFVKEHTLLLTRVLANLRDKQEAAMNGLSEETKNSLAQLITPNSIEEIWTVLLLQAADCSVASHIKLSNFIYRAASIWESAAMRAALDSMSRGLMDMFMKARPELS